MPPALAVFLPVLGKWLGDHLAAIATFAAALVALFKEDLVKRWRRPKITCRILLKSPDSGVVPTVVNWRESGDPEIKTWAGDVYYFRLWIENDGLWPAERVQVYVRSISNRLGDNRLEEVQAFIPMNLKWSHSPAGNPIIFETLNPEMGKHCDFGSVSPTSNLSEKPLAGMRAGESTFNLATEVSPNSNCHRLKPGKYRLELLVAAQNARPKLFRLDLDWSGIFEVSEGRMFTGSVGVKISQAKP